MKPHVQALCDRLVGNDPSFTEHVIDLDDYDDKFDEDDMALVFKATKKNITLKKLLIKSGSLSVRSALSLASALLMHPKITEMKFLNMKMISDFSAIALAFQQNENLNCLRLETSDMTPNLMENIRCLLMENAIELLYITDCDCEEDHPLDLSGGLRSNQSLKELVLKDVRGRAVRGGVCRSITLSAETILDIPWMIRANQDIRTIDLSKMNISSEMLSQIAQTVEGHNSLKKLVLDGISLYGRAAAAIGIMLIRAPSLRELELKYCSVGPEEAFHIATGLRSASCALEKLNLAYNDVGSAGASALAGALSTNNTLNYLDLTGNLVGDDGVVQLIQMLMNNATLETVRIPGGFGQVGLKAFVDSLPHMRGVKTLDLSSEFEGFTSEIGNILLKAIEQNTTLEHFSLHGICCHTQDTRYRVSEIMRVVRHLLALNRGGRRILKSPSVPRSLWSRVLGRSSNDEDIVFFFLRATPYVLFESSGTRKRKRGNVDV